MEPVITVKDVITFYKADRILYEMFVAQGMELGTARKAVAFFIWLKQVGKITPDTNIINNTTIISTLIAEAETILCCLQQNDGESSYPEIPLITSLAKNSIHPGFFNIHKDLIIRGLADIIDGIGSYVFNDHMYELLCSYEYSKELAAGGWLGAVSPEVPIALAKVYAPAMTMLLPEQIRSMFITFDSEFPIDRDEIVQHFTR
ncbi:hypothetical protein LUZ61_013810 [Rhynchospora tenuis]|uniref:Uncharacterized protein n=1 Tax=Rhynchospora tenuis TaxID=198213 RepID=A0AAD5W9V9_9POAL|nr:hypothetical protein LUZ61_013810 [Rhynchospora tenuis]